MTEPHEIRSVPFTLTRDAAEGDGLTLAGYAAVFDTPTRIHERGMEFDEQIARGAFTKTISERKPVLQFDHGQGYLAGLPIGAITQLREDNHGLYVEARLHDNDMVKPVTDAIASGALDGMSFRFNVIKDDWQRDGEIPVRTLHEVRLHELGPVTFPAYTATSVAVRAAILGTHEEAGPDEGTTSDTEPPPSDEPRKHSRTHSQRRALVALSFGGSNG